MPKLSRRAKVLLSIAGALILVLILGARLLDTYVNWLWFGELGFRSVFTTVLLTRISLFFIIGLLVGGLLAISLIVAYRTRPVFVPVTGADDPLAKYRSTIVQRVRLFGIGIPVVVGAIAGAAGQGDWQVVQLFMNGVPFGEIRVRLGGGLAGHNGLKSLKAGLGSADFGRVRVGVDRPDHRVVRHRVSPGQPHPLGDHGRLRIHGAAAGSGHLQQAGAKVRAGPGRSSHAAECHAYAMTVRTDAQVCAGPWRAPPSPPPEIQGFRVPTVLSP